MKGLSEVRGVRSFDVFSANVESKLDRYLSGLTGRWASIWAGCYQLPGVWSTASFFLPTGVFDLIGTAPQVAPILPDFPVVDMC